MRTATRAFAGLALVGVMLAAHFASLVHLVMVPHVACLEHGDLVHAGNDLPAPAAGEGAALSSAPEADDHDHCSVLAQNRTVAQVMAPVARLVAPCASVDVGHELLGCASVAVLHFAPKASPPA